MGLFKPKAPKTPEGGAYRVHFAGDDRNPDGSYKQTPAALPINDAVERVALELARLRATSGGGAGLPRAASLQRCIEDARRALNDASKELELKRRQFTGGVVSMEDVSKAARAHDACHSRLRALYLDLDKRKKADDAQAELARILGLLK
ncbi:hypothetical protein [Paraburkholderia caledonica]|uniref:hypothetical protein n=1 Tax=Paraburkholderia caledonica TaxID=134536 RepID=UPI000B48EC09|nr:hypothetical protein BWU74_18165 [Burkholderia sp. Bk]